MTDHTPSPATDGLRERLTALAEDLHDCRRYPGHSDSCHRTRLLAVLADYPALLADPAPEAARGPSARMIAGAAQHRPFRLEPVEHDYATPADLPVATGVTTEDEGARPAVCGDWPAPCNCDDPETHDGVIPAPAPVVSAGDEGALSEDEREALRFELERPVSQRLPQVVATVERILAARVAEAGARADREAWEVAHDVFCPRAEFCSTHLRPGDRHWLHPGRLRADQ